LYRLKPPQGGFFLPDAQIMLNAFYLYSIGLYIVASFR